MDFILYTLPKLIKKYIMDQKDSDDDDDNEGNTGSTNESTSWFEIATESSSNSNKMYV